MGRAASLHDDQGDGSILEERFELRTTQSMALTSLPASIGHGQLEHVLARSTPMITPSRESVRAWATRVCAVAFNSDSFTVRRHSTPHEAGWHIDAEKRGGVHSINRADVPKAAPRSLPAAHVERSTAINK